MHLQPTKLKKNECRYNSISQQLMFAETKSVRCQHSLVDHTVWMWTPEICVPGSNSQRVVFIIDVTALILMYLEDHCGSNQKVRCTSSLAMTSILSLLYPAKRSQNHHIPNVCAALFVTAFQVVFAVGSPSLCDVIIRPFLPHPRVSPGLRFVSIFFCLLAVRFIVLEGFEPLFFCPPPMWEYSCGVAGPVDEGTTAVRQD